MLSSQPRSMLLDNVQLSGAATKFNVLLAAGAILKPALDSSLLIPSDSPVSPVVTLSKRVFDLTYSKGLSLFEHTAKWYQHHDIAVPSVRTTKPIPSSMPLLQPSSTMAGVMFGMAACFLSLVAAGTFLVRNHAGSQSGGPSSPPPLRSLSETLAYNREQRQAQDARGVPRRRSGRGPPDPIPPNNNHHNNIPTEDMKPHRPNKRLQVRGIGAPPPPPPPPPPPAAVHADKAGGKAGGNTLWKCLFGLSVMAFFVKFTSTSNRYCSQDYDILVDSDDTSSMPLSFIGQMELQDSVVVLRSPLGSLLARFQVLHEAVCDFIPTAFTSPCLFLRLATDYLLCTLLCWILLTICALASRSTCAGIHQVEEDEIIKMEVGLMDIPQLEDLENPEQVSDAPNPAEDIIVVSLPSESDGDHFGPSPASSVDAKSSIQPAERRVPPPGRNRRTRPRRHPNRPPQTHTSDHAVVPSLQKKMSACL